ncbi:hypothetical protein RMSM_04094 [Rhodopirellula maiorica SM1]|uniref:Uncharacterized protein n=1 Tax=Rhodopirellula maiorica SM1 TaxID=1265738 RepID=M5RI41_9BACT|nr:hypothetical protein RMSM_04094 [Rhodopirellula maiorica SM1]
MRKPAEQPPSSSNINIATIDETRFMLFQSDRSYVGLAAAAASFVLRRESNATYRCEP